MIGGEPMLLDADVDLDLWAEAMLIANYIRTSHLYLVLTELRGRCFMARSQMSRTCAYLGQSVLCMYPSS
jgi:hypothetical protein